MDEAVFRTPDERFTLRFSTAVEAATANGAAVYPYRWRDDTAATFASSSGRDLVERGLLEDVRYAAETDVSDVIPVLSGGAFRHAS